MRLASASAAALLWAWTARAGPGPSAVEPAQVRVTTDPPGAAVLCDGVVQDASPVTVGGLAPGDHLVAASKPGFVEARRTVTTAPGRKTALELKLEPLTGLVLVHSSPPGADVAVDGAHRGSTPRLLTDLPVGRHRVTLTAAGYHPREIDLVIPDRIPRRVMVDLASDSAKLQISSEPAGAQVSLDGILRGTTPCEVDRIEAGEHEMAVALDNHAVHTQRLKLQAGDVNRVSVALTPIPASLSVSSVPPGAQVYLDGQARGDAPLLLQNLEPGTHALRVELPGYETENRTVVLDKAGRHAEEFRLARNSGTLELVTEPAGVTVFIDGKERGVTAAGMNPLVSEPFRVDLLAQGEHRLQLTRKDHYAVEKTFTVETNKTVALHEALKRRFVPDTTVRTPREILTGRLVRRFPEGDLELETKPGIYVTIKAADIRSVEPLAALP